MPNVVSQYLRSLKNPAIYHGHGKKPDFFEGWYFKAVTADGNKRYAFIPGIFLHKNPAESHAFIQTLDGMTGRTTYHRFDLKDFWASDTTFEVRIGNNFFSAERMKLDIQSQERTIHGELHFQGLTPWPVTLRAPGVMGWYAYIPIMECYHGVVSMDHTIDGSLTVDGEAVDFAGGRGYIEKDWGQSFPRGYVWMQTNHFEQPETCLMASIARIPWRKAEFPGFLAGFWHHQTLYRFTTYTGARTKSLQVTDSHVYWTLANKKYTLEISAERASGGTLHAPYRTGMLERVVESLTASVQVRLKSKQGIIFDGTGRYAGLEVAGDLTKLVDP